MNVRNPWTGYFTRSYEQIRRRVLDGLAVNAPEITDNGENTLHVKMVSVWAGIAEMLGYSVDARAREVYIDVLRLPESARSLAAHYDYRIHSALPSLVVLRFALSEAPAVPYTIPAGVTVSTDEGMTFRTLADLTLDSDNYEGGYVDARQVSDEVFVLNTQYRPGQPGAAGGVRLPVQAADGTVGVSVVSEPWELVDTLAYQGPLGKAAVASVDRDGVPSVYFGDGVNGQRPQTNDTITITYRTTEGATGNVAAGRVRNITGAMPPTPGGSTLTVTNPSRATGGEGIEGIETLRRRMPASLRTLERAVTRQDYIDVAERHPPVARAGVTYDCGKFVDVFIVPVGGGVPPPTLIESTQRHMDARRMITTRVRVHPAGEVRVVQRWDIRVRQGRNVEEAVGAMKQALSDFLSYVQQEVSGTVYLSDLYEVVENVPAILNSRLHSAYFTPYPHADPDTGAGTLNWTVAPGQPVSAISVYMIMAVGADAFHLYRDNQFLRGFNVGDTVTVPGAVFVVEPGAYAANHRWNFRVYPTDLITSGSVVLQEPSLPVSLQTDIIVTVLP